MKRYLPAAAAVFLLCTACTTAASADQTPKEVEKMDFSNEPDNVIFLAGGCFWGMEKLMEAIPGVTNVTNGYANGTGAAEANYERIHVGDTGFKETVRVEYDPDQVSLDKILMAYFYVIDPTLTNRQGNDFGTQYQTGIWYTNDKTKEVVERIADVERSRVDKFAVEVGPLQNFYVAEEYHQDYLKKNPNGYCHVPSSEIEIFKNIKVDPGDYSRPAQDVIKEKLTEEQYKVTQENGTERPFTNILWNTNEKGIYVDVVSGEPLFSSKYKYQSSCGWPSFYAPIEETSVVEKKDNSFGMARTEVRSRVANSHLGHVFLDDPESPNGIRYCINGASLRFVPYDEMEAQGYGYLLNIFDE